MGMKNRRLAGLTKPIVSPTTVRVFVTVAGGFAAAILGNILLVGADIWWLHRGNPDAGQLGVIGVWVGLPIGCVITWIWTGRLKRPRS